MLRLIRKHSILFLWAALIPSAAEAYVDPGNGHLLFQLGFAFIAGVLFYMRSIVDWFRPGQKETSDDYELESTAPTPAPVAATKPVAKVRKIKKPAAKRKKTTARKPAARKRA